MSNVPIIILHGWGLCGKKYSQLSNLLENRGYKVYAPDLPGFGSEPLRSGSMNLGDYVDFLQSFMRKNKILKPILIGHSFGGRIAIKYSWRYPDDISKLILTGVPVIRNKSFVKKTAFVFAVVGGKLLKGFPDKVQEAFRKCLYFLIGEWDYYKAGKLKQVFKNVIGEDLVQYLKGIKIPVLFIWGEEDGVVPLSDFEKIKQIKPHAKFIVVSHAGHKLPYEKGDQFLSSMESFL